MRGTLLHRSDKSPSGLLVFIACFSLIFGFVSILLTKRGKRTITDERIDKILDKSARNSLKIEELFLYD